MGVEFPNALGCNNDNNISQENKEDLIMASVARDSGEAVRRRHRINMLYSAHEEAMQTAVASPAPMAFGATASAAFTDILPVIRAMVKSEDSRCKDQKNSNNNQLKRRSRNERFIHYFDCVNICLTEKHLETLKKPFTSY